MIHLLAEKQVLLKMSAYIERKLRSCGRGRTCGRGILKLKSFEPCPRPGFGKSTTQLSCSSDIEAKDHLVQQKVISVENNSSQELKEITTKQIAELGQHLEVTSHLCGQLSDDEIRRRHAEEQLSTRNKRDTKLEAEIERLNDDVDRYRSRANDLERDVHESNRQVEKERALKRGLKVQLPELSERLQIYETIIIDLTAEREELRHNLEVTNNHLRGQLSDEESKRQHAEEQLSTRNKRDTKLEAEIERLNDDVDRYRSRANDLERDVHESKRQKEKERALKRGLKVQLHELSKRLQNYETIIIDLTAEREELRQNLEVTNNRLRVQLSDEEIKRQNAEEQLEEETALKLELEEQLREQSNRLQENETVISHLIAVESSLQDDCNVLRSRVRQAEVDLHSTRASFRRLSHNGTPDWRINHQEIIITDQHLGKGGWASVTVAKFRGSKVAVKQMHELILSDHNREVFEREMTIASQCRHPCLLQFIGATNDVESPLFVTELLETDLRCLLSQRHLEEHEIVTLGLDIVCALNYLHMMQPLSIIHRDISSANVLLWQKGNVFRAKISDYGAANFMMGFMTKYPGAVIYSAPEAGSPNQTPMLDIYSFGVLLMEMCIGVLPIVRQRREQIIQVQNREHSELIRLCVQQNPTRRPTAENLITYFERWNKSTTSTGASIYPYMEEERRRFSATPQPYLPTSVSATNTRTDKKNLDKKECVIM